MLADLIAKGGISAESHLAECQVADLLSQRLVGMGAFLTALAVAAPEEATVDVLHAVRDLTLAEQARWLAGPTASKPRPHSSGDLTLFED